MKLLDIPKRLFSHFQMMIFPNLSIQNSQIPGDFPALGRVPVAKNALVAPLRQDVATGLRGLWAQLGAANDRSFLQELQSHEAFGKARQHGNRTEVCWKFWKTNLSYL
jgi:hypothetical protein